LSFIQLSCIYNSIEHLKVIGVHVIIRAILSVVWITNEEVVFVMCHSITFILMYLLILYAWLFLFLSVYC